MNALNPVGSAPVPPEFLFAEREAGYIPLRKRDYPTAFDERYEAKSTYERNPASQAPDGMPGPAPDRNSRPDPYLRLTGTPDQIRNLREDPHPLFGHADYYYARWFSPYDALAAYVSSRRSASDTRINPTSDARLAYFRRFYNSFSMAVRRELERIQLALGTGKGNTFDFKAAIAAANELPQRVIAAMGELLQQPVPPRDHPDLPPDDEPTHHAQALASIERDFVLALLEPYADPEFFETIASRRYPATMANCETAARLWGMEAIHANRRLRAEFRNEDQARIRALAPKRAQPDGAPPKPHDARVDVFLDYLSVLYTLISSRTSKRRRDCERAARRAVAEKCNLSDRHFRRLIKSVSTTMATEDPQVASAIERSRSGPGSFTESDLRLLISHAIGH